MRQPQAGPSAEPFRLGSTPEQAGPTSPGRRIAARVLAVCAVLVLLPAVWGALFGGFELAFFGVRASVGSLRLLRWTALLGLAAAWLDPAAAGAVSAWLRERRRPLLLSGLGLAIAWLVAFKVYQHLSFGTGAYDLSMFHHAVHNTLRGRFLHAFGIERNFFSEHFSPALLLAVPLYAVWQSALSMLVLQGALVGLALWPLYRFAIRCGLDANRAALVCVGFFVNAVLWRSFAFDFHIELFEPVAFFAAAAALYARRFLLFYLAVLALLSVKEDAFLLVLPLSVLAVLRRPSDKWHAVGSAALALVWAVVAMKVAIPLSYPEAATQSHFVGRYAHLGGSYGEILRALLLNPGFVLGRIFSAPVYAVVASVGFVPLLDPVVLILGLPALGIHLISGYDFQASLGVYYGLAGMLVFFLSVPRVAGWLKARGHARWATVVVLLPLLVAPDGRFRPRTNEADAEGRRLLADLPVEATVAAQTSVLPHLSADGPRRLFPDVGDASVVVLDLQRSTWPVEPAEYRREVRALLEGGAFGVRSFDGRFVVLERGAPLGRAEAVLEALAATR